MLLIAATSLQAQDFSLRTLFGGGIKIDSKLNYTIYQSSVTIEPRFKINNIELSSINTSLMNDSSVSYWTGLQVGYFLWQQKDKTIEVLIQGQISMNNEQSLGIGVEYITEKIIFKVTGAKQLKSPSAIFMAFIGIPIL